MVKSRNKGLTFITARSCRLVTDKPIYEIDFNQLQTRIFYSERSLLIKYVYIALIQSCKRFTSDYKFQQLRVFDRPQQQLS